MTMNTLTITETARPQANVTDQAPTTMNILGSQANGLTHISPGHSPWVHRAQHNCRLKACFIALRGPAQPSTINPTSK